MDQLEYSLVASVLKAPDNIPDVLELVGVEAISTPSVAQVYTAIVGLWLNTQPIDLVTVFKAGGGDASFIAGMFDSVASKAKENVLYYAGEVAKGHRARLIKKRLAEIGESIDLLGPDEAMQSISALVADQTYTPKQAGDIGAVMERVDAGIADTRRNGAGIASGFEVFDHRLYALHTPGHVHAVGGFTSVGKTAFAIEVISRMHETTSGARTVVISTEMTESQVIARLVARKTGVPTHAILGGELTGKQYDQVQEAKAWILTQEIKIFDSIYDLGEMEAAIRKEYLRGGVDLVVVDYMQNISVKGARSEYEQHDMAAKAFQRIAKANKTNIMILSQFSNDFAKSIKDGGLEYKGGGTLAAVCDVGIVLFRSDKEEYLVMCDVRKHRHGRLGRQAMQFMCDFTRIDEVDHVKNK